jgi:branched-chain amino acid aminotransferase
MPEVLAVNGRSVCPTDAAVSACDRGFLYGEALFETMRAYKGVIFRLDDHVARLKGSAGFLGFGDNLDAAALAQAVRSAVAESQLADAYIRVTVTSGQGRGLTAKPVGDHTVVVEVRQLAPYSPHLYERGARLMVSRYHRDERSPLTAHKITNYVLTVLAKREAAAQGYDDAILLNSRGEVAEASVSNVFIVKEGVVLTPSCERGILPGITRQVILDLCPASGLRASEVPIGVDALFTAQEAFLTNTLMEVMPVREIDGRTIGMRAPGPVTRELARQYRLAVEREVLH